MLLMILSATLIQVIVMVIVITMLLVLLTGLCISAVPFPEHSLYGTTLQFKM